MVVLEWLLAWLQKVESVTNRFDGNTNSFDYQVYLVSLAVEVHGTRVYNIEVVAFKEDSPSNLSIGTLDVHLQLVFS